MAGLFGKQYFRQIFYQTLDHRLPAICFGRFAVFPTARFETLEPGSIAGSLSQAISGTHYGRSQIASKQIGRLFKVFKCGGCKSDSGKSSGNGQRLFCDWKL